MIKVKLNSRCLYHQIESHVQYQCHFMRLLKENIYVSLYTITSNIMFLMVKFCNTYISLHIGNSS